MQVSTRLFNSGALSLKGADTIYSLKNPAHAILFATIMSAPSVTVSAASNIALIKYWGKESVTENQPSTASLSIGLEDLRTTTSVTFSDSDQVTSTMGDQAEQRMLRFLDQVRYRYDLNQSFHITTENNFPTGTGLASSASGFAALVIALNELVSLQLDSKQQSQLARLGSGSAARSIFGGFAEIVLEHDAYARALNQDWPLDVVIAITTDTEKSVGSTEAMLRTAETSPFYRQWVTNNSTDIDTARRAIQNQDLISLGSVAERNCLNMHTTMMSSSPPIQYWLPATISVMSRVRELRQSGIPCFFTIDAGSQVKVVCEPKSSEQVAAALTGLTGVARVIRTSVGGEPRILT